MDSKIRWCETHEVSMFIADGCYKRAVGLRQGDDNDCVSVDMVMTPVPDEADNAQARFEAEAEYAMLKIELMELGLSAEQAIESVRIVGQWMKDEGGHLGRD